MKAKDIVVGEMYRCNHFEEYLEGKYTPVRCEVLQRAEEGRVRVLSHYQSRALPEEIRYVSTRDIAEPWDQYEARRASYEAVKLEGEQRKSEMREALQTLGVEGVGVTSTCAWVSHDDILDLAKRYTALQIRLEQLEHPRMMAIPGIGQERWDA